jgi:hypothetical protein
MYSFDFANFAKAESVSVKPKRRLGKRNGGRYEKSLEFSVRACFLISLFSNRKLNMATI